MLCQTLHVRIASDTQKIGPNDVVCYGVTSCPAFCWANVISNGTANGLSICQLFCNGKIKRNI